MNRATVDPDLLRTHAPFLRSLARALRDDISEAEDLAQETMRRALERSPRESATGAVRGWLARVMRSVRREASRASQRRRAREQKVAPPEASDSHDPARIVERLELVGHLARAVAELPEPYRGTIIAHHLDELSPAAIARRSSIPLATVHTRLRRGRELLRKRLCPRDDSDARVAWMAGLDLLTHQGGTVLPAWISLRIAAALLVCLTTGIGGWWWLTDGESHRFASSRASRSTEPMIAAAATTPPHDPVPAREPAPSASDWTITEDRPCVAAQVVLAERGEPAVGATVSFREIGATPLAREQFTVRLYSRIHDWWFEDDDQRQRDVEAFLADAGGPLRKVGTTDGEGVVVLPPFEDAIVLATLGERRLIRRLSSTDARPIRLALELPAALTIRVVDRHGEPAPRTSVAMEADNGRNRELLWRSHTGLDGCVVVPPRHFERFREEYASSLWAVTLGLAATGSPTVTIDPAELPTTPVELMLPACGRVRVELRDADDRRITSPALVGLARADPERPVNQSDIGMAWRLTSDGFAEFEEVPLGLPLIACPVDRRHSSAPLEFSGPTREGETAQIVMKFGPRLPMLRGRIVQADGSPMGDWSFRSRWSIASAPHLGRVVTDREGRFELSLARYDFETDEPHGTPVDVGWLTLRPFEPDLLDPALLEAAIVLRLESHLLEPGDHDLGDLRCADSQVVAAGRIVDSAGEPVRGVDLAVLANTERGWRKVSGLESRSSDEGAFTIVGWTALTPLQCAVESSGWRSASPIAFTPGMRDLVVVVDPTASLRGHVLLDPDIPVDQIALRPSESLQPLGDVRELVRRGTPPVTLREDGSWCIALLSAGRGTLEIGLGNGVVGHFAIEPMVTIEGVANEKEGEQDPRLAAIDLRGRLRVIPIEVRDRDGAPLPGARIEARSVTGDGALGPRRRFITDGRGDAKLLAAAARYTLLVSKDGFAERALADVGSDCTIELDRQR